MLMTFPEHGEVTDQDIGEKLNAMQCCRSWIFKFSSIKINDNNDNLPSNTCLPLPPTAQVGKIPPEWWVWGARCLPLPPTAQVGSTPYMGWAHLHGGQSPFSLEYQTQTCPHHIWYSSNWNGGDPSPPIRDYLIYGQPLSHQSSGLKSLIVNLGFCWRAILDNFSFSQINRALVLWVTYHWRS